MNCIMLVIPCVLCSSKPLARKKLLHDCIPSSCGILEYKDVTSMFIGSELFGNLSIFFKILKKSVVPLCNSELWVIEDLWLVSDPEKYQSTGLMDIKRFYQLVHLVWVTVVILS